MVTTRNITAARPSTAIPSSKVIPMSNHSQERSTSAPPITSKNTTRAMTKEAPVARTPMPAPRSGVRLPKKEMARKATSGRTGISHACSITGSPLEEVDLVHVHGLPVAEDEDDDGQADADLGGRHGDDEEREHLAGDHYVPPER